MKHRIKIGTRESQLAVWQASLVQNLLKEKGIASELVYIKSEGDIDIVTPLYELGVQGIFTKALDAALLNGRIDIAVHSMKDVPTQPAQGIDIAAVLKRANPADVLVFKGEHQSIERHLHSPYGTASTSMTIATGSIRRRAQWLNRYPSDLMENLRGNVNTRLRKLAENLWDGAVFAAAGLERIGLRPDNAIDLDWMLPAPAQGAIAIACRSNDAFSAECSGLLNDPETAICTAIERDFLRTLSGGCSTPISGLAAVHNQTVFFHGNLCSPDGRHKLTVEKQALIQEADGLGIEAGNQLLDNGLARQIISDIKNGQ